MTQTQPIMPPPDHQTRKNDGKQPEQQEICKRRTKEIGAGMKYLQVPKPIGGKKETHAEGKQQKNLTQDRKKSQGRTPQNPQEAAKISTQEKALAGDNIIMEMKYWRTMENRLQRNQRSRSLSRRHKQKCQSE